MSGLSASLAPPSGGSVPEHEHLGLLPPCSSTEVADTLVALTANVLRAGPRAHPVHDASGTLEEADSVTGRSKALSLRHVLPITSADGASGGVAWAALVCHRATHEPTSPAEATVLEALAPHVARVLRGVFPHVGALLSSDPTIQLVPPAAAAPSRGASPGAAAGVALPSRAGSSEFTGPSAQRGGAQRQRSGHGKTRFGRSTGDAGVESDGGGAADDGDEATQSAGGPAVAAVSVAGMTATGDVSAPSAEGLAVEAAFRVVGSSS